MTQEKPIYRQIAAAVVARQNCIDSNNEVWADKWDDVLKACMDRLPSGSGFNSGCYLNEEKTTGSKIVIETSFHHIHDSGYYDGWTEHAVTIRPTFDGIDITVSGRNRNDIKEYITDTFYHALTDTIDLSKILAA